MSLIDIAHDVVDIHAGVEADLLRVVARHHTDVRPRLNGRELDAQPGLKLALVGPDGGHLGPRVARDHAPAPALRRREDPAQTRVRGYGSVIRRHFSWGRKLFGGFT